VTPPAISCILAAMARGRQLRRQWLLLRGLESARRGSTAEELLELLDEPASMRTVYRDLEVLQEVGFPVVSEDGRWRLLASGEGAWSVPVEPTQVLALLVSAELLAPVAGSWLATPLDELRRTLEAMLTPVTRAWVAELRQSAVASLFGTVPYQEHRATLDASQDAIVKQHRLHITYEVPGRPPEPRTVEPYCTWFAAGRVYLLAWCRQAEDVRTFAIQRIGSAEVTDEPFEPDPAFDVADFVRRGFGVYHGPSYHFVIDFRPEVAHYVRERRFHHTQRVTERAGGEWRLTMDAAGLPEVAAWVAGFGGAARPIGPRELVSAVAELHRAGLERMSAEVVSRADTGSG